MVLLLEIDNLFLFVLAQELSKKKKRNKTGIIYFFRGQSGLVLEKAAKEKQKTTRFVTINIHPRD